MQEARVLAIMGSGELGPTMAGVHRELIARLETTSNKKNPKAVFIDSTYGFQENAAQLSEKAVDYFQTNIGCPIEIASLRQAATATAAQKAMFLNKLEASDYIVAGPGSPTYALQQLNDPAIAQIFREKLANGGCLVVASAAAMVMGAQTLPVYEIYKVGEDPHWVPGLDICSAIGLNVAVITHFDNAEGGTHDTRFCYIGERRMLRLDAQLEDAVDILGIDEHTACIIDCHARTLSVQGLGGVTIGRYSGPRARWITLESGTTHDLDELFSVRRKDEVERLEVVASSPLAQQVDQVKSWLNDGDISATIEGLLSTARALDEWPQDRDSSAREAVRAEWERLVVRLGELASVGGLNTKERMGPLVDAILDLRAKARSASRYEEADRLRDTLIAVGVEIRDAPSGVDWVFQDGFTNVRGQSASRTAAK